MTWLEKAREMFPNRTDEEIIDEMCPACDGCLDGHCEEHWNTEIEEADKP